MNIENNYNKKNVNSKSINMKAVKIMKEPAIEKNAENILKLLCDFNSYDLNFSEFYEKINKILTPSIKITNCDSKLYEIVCNKLNKVMEIDPLDVQLYRTDVNNFLSDLYKKGEYNEIFVEKQFDVIYKKQQELKSYTPKWMRH